MGGNVFRSQRCMNTTSTTTMTMPTILMSMTTNAWRSQHQEAGKEEEWVTLGRPKKTEKDKGRLKESRGRSKRKGKKQKTLKIQRKLQGRVKGSEKRMQERLSKQKRH